MYKTVIVGPQLLHSEENITSLSSTSDNLHPPHPSVFDNIFTKKNKVLPSHALASLVSHLPQLRHVDISGTQADDLTLARYEL